MRLNEISLYGIKPADPIDHIKHPEWDEAYEGLPRTVGEYIKHYNLKPGPFTQLYFRQPNFVISWEGTPLMLAGLDISGTKIASLDGLDIQYVSNLNLWSNRITSYHNIHQHVRACDRISINGDASHLLGVIKCTKRGVDVWSKEYTLMLPLARILIQHLDDKDIHAAQEKLIDADFIEQAQL